MNIPLFDAHCDTAFELFCNGGSLLKNSGHIDLERMSAYSPCAQFFAMFVMTEDELPERRPRLDGLTFEQVFDGEIENFYREAEKNSDKIAICRTAGQAAAAANEGKVAAFLSIEGAEAIGCSLYGLHNAHELGVRAIHPVWNRDNSLCGCAVSGTELGLTEKGREFVKEAGRLGMIVDVSHMSERGFWDVCNVLNRPFMAGHSNSRMLCDVPRNLTDPQFNEISRRGGVVGINFYTEFLGENADLYDVVRHIEHFMALGGEKNVALGCDLDGCDSLPKGVRGIEDMGALYELLLKENYREDIVRGIFYNNLNEMVGKICGI